jgi:hypothetical protein
MNEKPLERLNYFNGQRLQAADFKLEQEYHMRVRRWLNRSLYTPGIASGLEVYKIEGAPKVKVLPGLAIDHLGREIILLEERTVDVVDHSGGGNSVCQGPYLTIRYQEEVIAQQDTSCAVGAASANKAAWGGPARILAEPVLELTADLPHEGSGKITLACIALAQGCASVETVDTGVRRYVREASGAKVRQYALEGVRDIDAKNSARIYFHIRGPQPNVTLYLKGDKFPTLYYTELGHHTHGMGMTPMSVTLKPHSHGVAPDESSGSASATEVPPKGLTGPAGQHGHTVSTITAYADSSAWGQVFEEIAAVMSDAGNPGAAAQMAGISPKQAKGRFYDGGGGQTALAISPYRDVPGVQDLVERVGMNVVLHEKEAHSHSIEPFPSDGTDQVLLLSGGDLSPASAGVSDTEPPNYRPREGDPLSYVDDLHIAIDGTDVTEAVRSQVINNRQDGDDWTKFGDPQQKDKNGQNNHPFVKFGTGSMRIDYLPGVVLGEGEHYIDLSVSGAGNGGRIHFNLYVE